MGGLHFCNSRIEQTWRRSRCCRELGGLLRSRRCSRFRRGTAALLACNPPTAPYFARSSLVRDRPPRRLGGLGCGSGAGRASLVPRSGRPVPEREVELCQSLDGEVHRRIVSHRQAGLSRITWAHSSPAASSSAMNRARLSLLRYGRLALSEAASNAGRVWRA